MPSDAPRRRRFRPAYWFYRALLIAYPAPFRREHGRDAAATFAELDRDTRGLVSRCRLWGRAIFEVSSGGWRARRERGPAPARAAGPAGPRFDQLARDARSGLRAWRQSPAHALVALASLALGIGVNLAVMNLLVTLFLRPPAGTDGDRLVGFSVTDGRRVDTEFSAGHYSDFSRQLDALDGLAAEQFGWVWLTGAGPSIEVEGALVSFNYFDVLGIRPAAGRVFHRSDEGDMAPHSVVVMSHALWSDQFGRDRSVIGRTVRLNGRPATIIGIAPAGFTGRFAGQRRDLWIPHDMRPTDGAGGAAVLMRAGGSFDLFGRLGEGRQAEEVAAQADAILNRDRPADGARPAVRTIVEPLRGVHPDARGEYLGPARLALGVAAALLLLTCLNLGGLLLARNLSRRRELALRLALGGTRARLVAQLLVEALVLALAAGVTGVVAAVWGHDLIARWYAYTLPGLALTIDWRFVGLALALTVGVALAFGVIPAWLSTRRDILGELKADASRVSTLGPGTFGQRSLIVGQMALSLLLLAGAAVMMQTMTGVMASAGTDPEAVLHYRLRPSRVPYDQTAAVLYQHDVLQRVGSVSGARGAALASVGPERGWCCPVGVSVDGLPSTDDDAVEVDNNHVTPGYLDVLGIPVLRGRNFLDTDSPGAPLVVIVNEALAGHLWPGADPLGRQLFADDRVYQVIGVTPTVHASRPGEGPVPYVHFAYWQSGQINARLYVRLAEPGAEAARHVRDALVAAGPDVHIGQAGTLAERTRLAYAPQQALAGLLRASAVTALLLTLLGLYAQLSIAVNRRARETAIRVAIGASSRRVLGNVVGMGVKLVGLGAAVGLVGVWLLSRTLESVVYGVAPADPRLVGAAVVVLAACATATALVPAIRAVRVDPVTLLRHE